MVAASWPPSHTLGYEAVLVSPLGTTRTTTLPLLLVPSSTHLPLTRRRTLPLLLLLSVMVVSQASLFDIAHAANLPPTITDGTHSSIDDTLPATNTTLIVPAMLADAVANNKTEVYCSLLRTTFEGTLTITLPTTAAAWTTTNIPLHLLILDGTSSTIIPTTYINITGVLALGSSITIEGGDYDYSDQFIELPFGITIQDGSSLTIEGGTYRLHYPSIGTLTFLMKSVGAITISNTSTLAIYSSTMVKSNVSVAGSWWVYTISTFSTSSPITISSTSTLAIYNNSMVVSNVSVAGNWRVYTIYTFFPSSPITISTKSTLTIYNSTMVVSSVSLKFNYLVFAISTSSSPITISKTSTVAISNSTMDASNVSVRSNWLIYTIYTLSSITISTNSTLAIYSNTMVVSNVSVRGGWEMYTLVISPITISNTSTLAIYNTALVVSDVSVGALWLVYTIYSLSSYITISSNSTLAISNSTVLVSNVGVSYPTCGMLWVSGTLQVDGVLEVSHTAFEIDGGYVSLLHMESTSYLNGSGMVSLRRNALNSRGILINVSGILGTPTPSIHTCNNFVNGIRCTATHGTGYSCATGVVDLGGSVEDCTVTHTIATSNAVSQTAHTFTTSQSSTLSLQPVCQPSPQPLCPYASEVAHSSILTTCSPSKGLSIAIPHSTYGGGSPFNLSVLLHDSLVSHFSSDTVLPPTSKVVVATSEGVTQLTTYLTHKGDTSLWAVSTLRYTGPSSRSTISLAISIQLPTDSFNCAFTESHPKVEVSVTLSEAKSVISDAVTVTMDVAKAVGAVSVVPSGLVRAGISSSVIGMLKCSEFEPKEEVGFVSNPFNWAAGREELQYHRGSVLMVLITLGVFSVCVMCVVVSIRMCEESVTTWGAALDVLRLPSLPLVFLVLLSEVAVSSATSMLLYGGDSSSGADVVLALMVLFPLNGYMGLYLYRTLVCSRYISVEPADVDYMCGADINAADDAPRRCKQGSPVGRAVQYAMEPTHNLVLIHTTTENGEEDTNQHDACVVWLRRNYYFVADRRWSPYGAIEVIGGTLTNMLEGIPMTTTSRALCIARPVCVILITTVLLVLLVWKVPNAVRLQHWCSLFVLGGMVVTSALASANSASPSEGVELAAGYTSTFVMGLSMLLGVIDMIVLTMTYIPMLRSLISFRVGGLQSTIMHSAKVHDAQQAAAAALQVPMLVIPPPPPPPLVDDNDSDIISDGDDVGADDLADNITPDYKTISTEVSEMKSDLDDDGNVINRDEDYDDDAYVSPVYTPSVTSKGGVNLCNAPHRLNKRSEAQRQRDILAELEEMDALDEAQRNSSKKKLLKR